MQEFEMIIDEGADFAGINAISLVSDPAIKEDFVFLSADQIKLKKISDEKRLLMGAVLIPEQRIVRLDEKGEPFNIYFSADTIRQASEIYMKAKKTDKATVEHIAPVNGVQVVETWIVENSKQDKTAAFDLSYPKGTWIVTMKVYDDEVWNDYVKTGKVKGYSIEGIFTRKTQQDKLSAIKKLLAEYEQAQS